MRVRGNVPASISPPANYSGCQRTGWPACSLVRCGLDWRRFPHEAVAVILPRRTFLKGLVGLVAAPAVVKADSLMRIAVWRPTFWAETIRSAPDVRPYEYLVCRRDDLLGVDPKSLGLWSPHSFSPKDLWHWDHHHDPIDELPQNRVIIGPAVELMTEQHAKWSEGDVPWYEIEGNQ